jgi:5-deoxy-glucuronate isomerase
MLKRHAGGFRPGYEALVERRGAEADMLMDFGVVSLAPGEAWDSGPADEKALLMMDGEAELAWAGGTAKVSRSSLFDESPAVLSLPSGMAARATAGPRGAEFCLVRTENPRRFEPRFYPPAACASEARGKGTMGETSTRLVRTVFDDSNAKDSMLVIGEVVGMPGRWSSYPPHHHPQPEIYHYRFLPENGFGLTAIGETPYILHHRDTVLIREGQVHPQVTAPGYTIWYLWVIRHLEGARYVTPIFVPEHLWVTKPDAPIWSSPLVEGGKR